MLSVRCLSCPLSVCLSVCLSCLFVTLAYCGQTVGWIKIRLGTEVGLGSGRTVLGGDPAPPFQRGTSPSPRFGPCLLWPNGWLDQDATWYGGRHWPGPHCVKWGPSPPPKKKGHSPQFSAHVYCGLTVANFSYC